MTVGLSKLLYYHPYYDGVVYSLREGFTQIDCDGNMSPDIQVSAFFTSIQLRNPQSSPI